MTRPLAVVVGFIGKLPFAGVTYYNLHYLAGLRKLGYDIHYVERQNKPDECYNPRTGAMSDDSAYALEYLAAVLPRFSVTQRSMSFIDRKDRCHGSGWEELSVSLNRADFVLTLADPTWFEELAACERRAFVDGDPLFTQVAMAQGEGSRAAPPAHYPVLFTYGVRLGRPDCTLPSAGREWLSTRPVVATEYWHPQPVTTRLPITALMHWAAGSEITYDGRIYGHKDRAFAAYLDLPQRTKQEFVLAVGGQHTPREEIQHKGWQLLDPLAATGTLEAYQQFVAGSAQDLGIAKHAYVASKCGWFSDRSTCFLAAGRPVLHQDTGLGDWLPTGKGVLLFSNMSELLEAIDSLDADYDRHCQAARSIAEECFEASTVIGRMLDEAGFR